MIMRVQVCRLIAAGAVALAFAGSAAAQDDPFSLLRERMVREQLEPASDRHPAITDPVVLEAMRRVPRHRFVPLSWRALAYSDQPLPIDETQTISQPYIVALMTQLAKVTPESKVLEIGTGSGYQAAVLAWIGAQVYSIEILEPLAVRAKETLDELGVEGVTIRTGDGYQGWPEEAPFDAIVVTAAAPRVPGPLLEQLAPGGRLVIPIGTHAQRLTVITKTAEGFTHEESIPVVFVPMTGQVQQPTKR